jgi:predicted alpha/beta superfamily hydrolase
MPAAPTPHRRGFLARYPTFPARHIASRAIEVWLPEQYQAQPSLRCGVLYMHDGRNLWYPAEASGRAWDVDLALADLIDQGAVPPTIIVAIPQHPRLRFQEYMPQAPLATERGQAALAAYLRRVGPAADLSRFISDHYLAFAVEELKPFIDAPFRTHSDATHTALMGSSMGGLISLYALTQHPAVFGGAGCLSTHWPALDGIMLDWLPGHLPDPATHRIYFDYGTQGLDKQYAPYQAQVDIMMRAAGYQEGVNWITYQAEGADHREDFWAARLATPLRFLLRDS